MFLSVRAVDMVTRHFGSVAAATLRTMNVEKLPLLLLVYRLRGNTEIFQVRQSPRRHAFLFQTLPVEEIKSQKALMPVDSFRSKPVDGKSFLHQPYCLERTYSIGN
jgi:hypothetical protein